MLSNCPLSVHAMAREYARRFTCEEVFRDSKRLLVFAETRVRCIAAWARMFLLVTVALCVLTLMGCALLERLDCAHLLRQVRSRRNTRSELARVRGRGLARMNFLTGKRRG